jgi:hypothetical protein
LKQKHKNDFNNAVLKLFEKKIKKKNRGGKDDERLE